MLLYDVSEVQVWYTTFAPTVMEIMCGVDTKHCKKHTQVAIRNLC